MMTLHDRLATACAQPETQRKKNHYGLHTANFAKPAGAEWLTSANVATKEAAVAPGHKAIDRVKVLQPEEKVDSASRGRYIVPEN